MLKGPQSHLPALNHPCTNEASHIPRRHPHTGSRVQASVHTCLDPSVSLHLDKQGLKSFFTYLLLRVHDSLEVFGEEGKNANDVCKGSSAEISTDSAVLDSPDIQREPYLYSSMGDRKQGPSRCKNYAFLKWGVIHFCQP